MKVYCPSKGRPDSLLFLMSENLNIIIQNEEDWVSYQKHKDRHNLMFIPGLRGLLDCRNWVFQYGDDDWILMLDDDVISYKELEIIDNQIAEKDISWNNFIKETEKTLSKLDKTEVGVVGFNLFKENFTDSFKTVKDFNLYQSVILNIPLLKSKGYKYESYPLDKYKGKKGFCEDMSHQCFCEANNLKRVRINNLFFAFDNEHQTTVWEDRKNREKMLIISFLWFLGKYSEYPTIVKHFSDTIFYFLKNLRYTTIDEIVIEIVNNVSYGTFNFEDIEEFVMKKYLILGLVLCGLVGVIPSLTSCGGGENEDTGKVVEEKYWGVYAEKAPDEEYGGVIDIYATITLSKNEYKQILRLGGVPSTVPAWTIGNELYINKGTKFGSFNEDGTILFQDARPGWTYVKQE
jgi:hypothetical protein